MSIYREISWALSGFIPICLMDLGLDSLALLSLNPLVCWTLTYLLVEFEMSKLNYPNVIKKYNYHNSWCDDVTKFN